MFKNFVKYDDHTWRFRSERTVPASEETAQDNHTWRFRSDR